MVNKSISLGLLVMNKPSEGPIPIGLSPWKKILKPLVARCTISDKPVTCDNFMVNSPQNLRVLCSFANPQHPRKELEKEKNPEEAHGKKTYVKKNSSESS